MDVNFQTHLEETFKTTFLENAPLYRAAGKVKLPYEDIKGTATLYRGSLSEQTRPVVNLADYELFKHEHTENDVLDAIKRLSSSAGILVDGLIRLENVQSVKESDPRATTNLRVVDIFEHSDGRRNLQIILAASTGPTVSDPAQLVAGWVTYRFYFAAANVRTEYKQKPA